MQWRLKNWTFGFRSPLGSEHLNQVIQHKQWLILCSKADLQNVRFSAICQTLKSHTHYIRLALCTMGQLPVNAVIGTAWSTHIHCTGTAWCKHSRWDSLMNTHPLGQLIEYILWEILVYRHWYSFIKTQPLGQLDVQTSIGTASSTHNNWDSLMYTYPFGNIHVHTAIGTDWWRYNHRESRMYTQSLEQVDINRAIGTAGWTQNYTAIGKVWGTKSHWDSLMYT